MPLEILVFEHCPRRQGKANAKKIKLGVTYLSHMHMGSMINM